MKLTTRRPLLSGIQPAADPWVREARDFEAAFDRLASDPLSETEDWDLERWKARPYIHATFVRGKLEIEGTRAWFGGHLVPTSPGDTADGIFAAWSAGEDAVEIRNDRYGFYPLYYFSTAKEFAASPSVLTLLACGASRELDDEGLAVFLRLGFFIQERTPFKHVRSLPPACTLRWSRGTLQVSGGMPRPTRQDITRSAALDGYIALFAQAIKRRSPARHTLALPLSGGRDSRHILFELLRQGYRPHYCITAYPYPPRPDEDPVVASQLTRALGIRHVVVRQPRSRVRGESIKNLWTGFCTDEHVQFLPVLRVLVRTRAGAVYDGIGGDVLSGDYLREGEELRLFGDARFEDLAESLLLKDRERTLAAILVPQAYSRFGRAAARAALMEELERHADRANPVGSFYFWNRTRRVVALAPYGLYSEVPDVFAPYLDRDMFDFVAGLPASMLLGRRFHTDAIHRAFPDYAHFRFEDEHVKPRADTWHVRGFAGGILARMMVRPSAFLQRGYLAPRLARRVSDGSNGLFGIYPELILYLLQLEEVNAA